MLDRLKEKGFTAKAIEADLDEDLNSGCIPVPTTTKPPPIPKIIANDQKLRKAELILKALRYKYEADLRAGKTIIKVILANQQGKFSKKFLVNNVARRQIDFTSHFLSVLFTPEDLEIVTDSPSLRRNYVNLILSQADRKYRAALSIYEKALRQRNRMLWLLREGKKYFSQGDFEYWDNVLILNGGIITAFREEFIDYVNKQEKDVFSFDLFYDKSTITRERLDKYHDAERATATTLVGPNRDDIFFRFPNTAKPISEFGSRGEQRLTIFQMKILETFYIKERTEQVPTLLLDDIFSELDENNIHRVLDLLPHQQTILTTTHKEFVPKKILDKEEVEIIEL
jgi:DNA replication and repair protein RecF